MYEYDFEKRNNKKKPNKYYPFFNIFSNCSVLYYNVRDTIYFSAHQKGLMNRQVNEKFLIDGIVDKWFRKTILTKRKEKNDLFVQPQEMKHVYRNFLLYIDYENAVGLRNRRTTKKALIIEKIASRVLTEDCHDHNFLILITKLMGL